MLTINLNNNFGESLHFELLLSLIPITPEGNHSAKPIGFVNLLVLSSHLIIASRWFRKGRDEFVELTGINNKIKSHILQSSIIFLLEITNTMNKVIFPIKSNTTSMLTN